MRAAGPAVPAIGIGGSLIVIIAYLLTLTITSTCFVFDVARFEDLLPTRWRRWMADEVMA